MVRFASPPNNNHPPSLVVIIRSICYSLSDTSEDEMDDQDVQKIIIVTQTPPAYKKHPGGDRTGNFISRPKMTTDMAAAINDGLYFYEQVCLCMCV